MMYALFLILALSACASTGARLDAALEKTEAVSGQVAGTSDQAVALIQQVERKVYKELDKADRHLAYLEQKTLEAQEASQKALAAAEQIRPLQPIAQKVSSATDGQVEHLKAIVAQERARLEGLESQAGKGARRIEDLAGELAQAARMVEEISRQAQELQAALQDRPTMGQIVGSAGGLLALVLGLLAAALKAIKKATPKEA